LLTQHATTYHFDRLKALVSLVTIIVMLAALMPPRFQRPALLMWLAVLCWNAAEIKRSRSIGVTPPLSTNDVMMHRVNAVARPCAIYATDVEPRAWVALSLRANAYEGIPSLDSVARLVTARGACQGLYFRAGRTVGQGIYIWQDATIIDATTGQRTTIEWSAGKDYAKTLAPIATVAP